MTAIPTMAERLTELDAIITSVALEVSDMQISNAMSGWPIQPPYSEDAMMKACNALSSLHEAKRNLEDWKALGLPTPPKFGRAP